MDLSLHLCSSCQSCELALVGTEGLKDGIGESARRGDPIVRLDASSAVSTARLIKGSAAMSIGVRGGSGVRAEVPGDLQDPLSTTRFERAGKGLISKRSS